MKYEAINNLPIDEPQDCPFCDDFEDEFVRVKKSGVGNTIMCKRCFEYSDFRTPYDTIQKVLRRAFDAEKDNDLAKEILYTAEHTQIQGVYLPEEFINEMKNDLS